MFLWWRRSRHHKNNFSFIPFLLPGGLAPTFSVARSGERRGKRAGFGGGGEAAAPKPPLFSPSPRRAAAAGRGPGGGVSPKGQVVSMPVYVWVNFFKVHKRRAYVAKPLRGSKVARRASLNQPNGLPSGGNQDLSSAPSRMLPTRTTPPPPNPLISPPPRAAQRQRGGVRKNRLACYPKCGKISSQIRRGILAPPMPDRRRERTVCR